MVQHHGQGNGGNVMLGKRRAIQIYKSMSAEDQNTFRWWAKANSILGVMLVAVLLTAASFAPSQPSLPQVAAERLGPAQP
jgi:putative copper export protein